MGRSSSKEVREASFSKRFSSARAAGPQRNDFAPTLKFFRKMRIRHNPGWFVLSEEGFKFHILRLSRRRSTGHLANAPCQSMLGGS